VIWHARRNNEMIVGVLLRALGWPLKLVFTSAAQRHHTWITRWLIRRMDAIIATNDISASFLKRKATVIPHGVDTDAYAPPRDRAAVFAEAGLPGRYAIGCFGRVRAQKGSDVFVDAMCRLLPRFPDFTAVLVGAITPEQTAFANDLRKRIEAAGLQSRVIITGELAMRTCSVVPAADDLRFHFAQRGFGSPDRGNVGGGGAGGVARGRRTRGRGWRPAR
jgi:mannosyltransferase